MGDGVLCDYVGCGDFVCEEDRTLIRPGSFRFCSAHSSEMNALIKDHNTPGVLRFWINANGGAEKLAGKMVGIDA